jgi:hypothetical protein
MPSQTGSFQPPGEYTSPLAPVPGYAEKAPTHYERKFSPAQPGLRGPMRFEEGVATDTDIPSDFGVGIMQGYITRPGRLNHNEKVDTKYPQETVRQRAHVGSAAWVEAPTFLGNFAHGTGPQAERAFEQDVRDGQSYRRANPATVWD